MKNKTDKVEDNTELQKQDTDTKAVGLLSLGHLTADSYGGFISPIMPFIADNLGISIGVASLILSISQVTSSMLQPIFGYISDSIKRRFFVVAGLLFASVFISLIGLVSNQWFLGITIVMGSLGVGLFHPQSVGLVTYFSGKKINNLMGIFTACGTIGYATGPIISSNIVENFGLKSTPYAAIPGLIMAFVIYKFLPKIPKDIKTRKQTNFKEACKVIYSNKILVTLTVLSVINALVVLSFTIYMPFMWKTLNYSVSQIGFLVGSMAILGGIASYSGGKLVEYTGRKKIFLISLFSITPLCLGTIHLLKSYPFISFILFVVIGFFIMLPVSINMVIAQTSAPVENRGMVSGITGGFSWGLVGLFLTPLGFLIEKFGIINVLTIIALIPALSTPLINNIPEKNN